MPNAYISGTGSYVPPKVVTNADLKEHYGIDTTHEWVVQRTGIEERRYTEDGVNNSDLAVHAAREALERAGLKPHDLDMILYATLSPDMHFPGSGVFLQRKLGLCDGDNARFVPCMDIRNQCSGFLYGLGTASSMVKSGACKHVLVVGSETHSPALDMTTRGRTVTTLFGDGAGAAVVSATEEDRGILSWHLGADGRGAEALCMRIWEMQKHPFIPLDERGHATTPPEIIWPYMEGKVVFKNAVQRMAQGLFEACAANGLTAADIDLFVFHQANKRINEYVAEMLGLPAEKVLHNIHKYGNTTAATIPLLLNEAEREGRLVPGMKVAMVAFGSGFTWGSAVCKW